MKKSFYLICLVSVAATAQAQVQTRAPCPEGTSSCTNSTQTLGDTSNPSSATNTSTTSSQSGVSSASNASGNSIDPDFDNRSQVNQNATNTTTGTISGGDSTSSATGGSATGNLSTNSNTSQSSVGNTTANGGAGGSSTATTGNNTNSNSTGASTSSASGRNQQGQGQGQGQALNGGNQLSRQSSNQSLGTSGNSRTTVDAADNSSTSYKAVFIPPVVPPTPPSSLAVGNIVKETSACGPLQSVVKEPVQGTFFGLLLNSRIDQGYTEELAPYRDENGQVVEYRREPLPDGSGYRLFGHQVTQYTAIVGVSGARNIAVGAGGSGGGWGQGGLGTSSANQQMVTTVQLRSCEIGTVLTAVPPLPDVAHIRQ